MESKKSGKGSFAFAWVLDETEEERTRYHLSPFIGSSLIDENSLICFDRFDLSLSPLAELK